MPSSLSTHSAVHITQLKPAGSRSRLIMPSHLSAQSRKAFDWLPKLSARTEHKSNSNQSAEPNMLNMFLLLPSKTHH
eukprot:6213737-Pleurochrysis_carterae.AAC.5